MELAYLRSDADIINARFGIRTSNQQKHADIYTLDWLVMPCVAYDTRGHRLGMGGGYYDRALEKCAPMLPVRIGVAFNMQKAMFEVDQWDQSFDWIVTEMGYPPMMALWATVTANIRPPIIISILNGSRRFMHLHLFKFRAGYDKNKNVKFSSKLN